MRSSTEILRSLTKVRSGVLKVTKILLLMTIEILGTLRLGRISRGKIIALVHKESFFRKAGGGERAKEETAKDRPRPFGPVLPFRNSFGTSR